MSGYRTGIPETNEVAVGLGLPCPIAVRGATNWSAIETLGLDSKNKCAYNRL